MDEKERRAKFDQQTDEIYSAIGRFAVTFEHVCHAIETTLLDLLSANGLTNVGLAHAMLAGLTAEPMLRIFRASIMEVRKDTMNPSDEKILRSVVKRISALIETRNDIIHRMWFVGWAAVNDTDFSTVDGWKFKNTAAGAEFRPLHFRREDFDAHSEEANELTKIIQRMMICLQMARPFYSSFVVEPDGSVRLPPQI